MRLHSLTLTAFGPFAGTECVDFDRLTESGLFLLSGPTGAGKTSILDGICFALYGTVPGARQTARSLRSDHASSVAAPRVSLEVTVRGRRLRVTRSPGWERPKRRGIGTTTEPAKVLVEELRGGEWATVSTRLDEAGDFLTTQLGLSAAQFCQVVLLPQGQFADFLRADADRRRILLETLFDTGRFADVEAWLVNRRQETGRALAEVDGELETLAARVAEVLAGDDAAVDEPGPVDDDPTAVEQLTARIAALHDVTVAARDDAGVLLAQASERALVAQTALDEARRVHALVARAATLKARLAELQDGLPWLAGVEAEIEDARSVESIRLLAEELALAESDLASARALAQSAERPVSVVLAPTGTDGAPPMTSRRAVVAARETRDTVATLRDVADDEAEADRLVAETTRIEAAAVELTARLGELRVVLETAEATRTELVRRRAAAQAAHTRLALATAEQERCLHRVRAARARDRVAAALTTARDELRLATDRHQAARDAAQDVRERRLVGMAGELALALRPDAPCVVCGSTAHPSPAAAAPGVSAAAEEEAAAVANAAETERRAAEQQVHDLEVDLAGHRTEAGGDEPLDSLERRLARAERSVTLDAEAAEALSATEERLAEFDGKREAALREQVALDEKLRAMEGSAAELGRRATLLRDRVTAARGADATVAGRISRLTELADHLERLGEVLSRVEHLTESRDRTQRRLLTALRERGLGSMEEVRRKARTPDEVRRMESAAERSRSELRSVEQQLSEPDLVEALATAVPALDQAERAVESADRAKVSAATIQAQLTGRAAALARLAEQAAGAVSRRAPLVAQHRVADRLARLAEGKSGDNVLRMSLSAYVLAARLEHVALAATERLLRMTSGRYALRHVATPSSGKGRGGLSLRVVDAWTGQDRDPGSLSGGESFTASLALALGLADVVAAEAGGVVLETLFVDEGFGTLDDDTLDDVMSVLDGLREGGRSVGIVSHVAELRQRIPTQIRLVKARSGSTVEALPA